MRRTAVAMSIFLCVTGSAVGAEAGSACASRTAALQLTESDAGRTVTVRCGTPVVVTAQNYTARQALSSAPAVVRVGAMEAASQPIVGSDRFHFATLRSGEAVVHIHRGLPFALPSPLPDPFDFDITIRVRG